MKKFGLLACAALFLFLTGCTEEPAPETRVTPTPGRVQVEITALPTATPVPTPTPLFLPRDDKGNLDINQDLENSLEPTNFPLAADTVILLYHTHGEEAFRQEKDYTYKETGEGTHKTLEGINPSLPWAACCSRHWREWATRFCMTKRTVNPLIYTAPIPAPCRSWKNTPRPRCS